MNAILQHIVGWSLREGQQGPEQGTNANTVLLSSRPTAPSFDAGVGRTAQGP